MLLTLAQKLQIADALNEGGQTADLHDMRIADGILWLRIIGGHDNGRAGLAALHAAGINQKIDNDYKTDESAVIYTAGADHCTVWVAIDPAGPLFRPSA